MYAIFDYCQGCSYKSIRLMFKDETVMCKNNCPYQHMILEDSRLLKSKLPIIERVIFNDPATIVFWSDDTKTVVKAQDDEEFDPEKGLAMAIAKKKLGNNGNYYNHIKKWLEPYYKKNETEE